MINFFGMRPKPDYIVWNADTNNGKFTAVDNTGLLQSWSTTTGKFVENENEQGVRQKEVKTNVFDFRGYSIFQGDPTDNSWKLNW